LPPRASAGRPAKGVLPCLPLCASAGRPASFSARASMTRKAGLSGCASTAARK